MIYCIAGLGPPVVGDGGLQVAGPPQGPGRAPALATGPLGSREESKEHRLLGQGRGGR